MLAALDCVAEHGFEGLRLREVATRAGIDHSTLHHHFATKQDLVESVVEHVMRQFRPTMAPREEPGERLHGHLSALARLIRDEPKLFAVMSELDQRAHYDPSVRAMLLDHESGWRTALRLLFDEGGWAVVRDVDAAVELVIAVVKGVRRNREVAAPVLDQLETLLTAG